jgi:hypothetical protein
MNKETKKEEKDRQKQFPFFKKGWQRAKLSDGVFKRQQF